MRAAEMRRRYRQTFFYAIGSRVLSVIQGVLMAQRQIERATVRRPTAVQLATASAHVSLSGGGVTTNGAPHTRRTLRTTTSPVPFHVRCPNQC